MFYMHGAGWGWGWWLVTSIALVAFWALVVYVIVWFARGRAEPPEQPRGEPPEQILKRRLARGEIGIEEYERVHAAMRGESPGGDEEEREQRPAA